MTRISRFDGARRCPVKFAGLVAWAVVTILLTIAWCVAHAADAPSPVVPIMTVTAAPPMQQFYIFSGGGKSILELRGDGAIRWRGRWIKTDREFRAAMIDLKKMLEYNCQRSYGGPKSGELAPPPR